MKRRATREAKPSFALATDSEGAVYVEFILSFIPLFFLFLGMVQVAMLYSAQLVVQQAAVTATRAAVVVMDDNPERYGGEERLSLDGSGGGGGSSEEGGLAGLFGSGGGGALPSLGSDTASRRYSSIRYAAMVPLIAVTPAPGAVMGGERLSTAIGSDPEYRAAVALLYTRSMTAITFPTEPRGTTLRRTWDRPNAAGLTDRVTGRVTYLYMCPVPLANRLLCEDGISMLAGNASVALAESFTRAMRDGTLTMAEVDELAREQERHEDHFEAWGPMMDEMEEGDGPGFRAAAAITAATIATNGAPARFRPLQAEATLPMQAANYCYRGQSASNCWEQEDD